MKSAVARAEKRLGYNVPGELLEEAASLTTQKIAVKHMPKSYAELLMEDEIVDACMRAAINGRYA